MKKAFLWALWFVNFLGFLCLADKVLAKVTHYQELEFELKSAKRDVAEAQWEIKHWERSYNRMYEIATTPKSER